MATATRSFNHSATARRPTPAPLIGEDWLAVWMGGLSIVLALMGWHPELPAFGWAGAEELAAGVFGTANLQRSLLTAAALGVLAGTGTWLMRGPLPRFAAGFSVIYVLTWFALVLAGNTEISGWGFEYVIFALLAGLFVSNVIGAPPWLREAARSEYFIKTGLVILGAGMLFDDLLQAGLLGITQAVLVVTAVWFVCFRLARRLRVDDEFATMLAAAVSICGVSAAIAACGAIQGDRKKLSYVTSLVLIVAAPMMVAMPSIVALAAIPPIVGGAWLGGTLDTSASVVAAGELISEPARNAGVVVKLSQNVLIGVAALLLTIWWTLRQPGPSHERPGLRVIWDRFPKFVLGFLAASFAFSFLVDATLVQSTKGLLTGLRTLWFSLAFTSIGLEARFSELVKTGGGRPALAFLGGQAFNVVWTLILAYVFFGGFFFPVPDFE